MFVTSWFFRRRYLVMITQILFQSFTPSLHAVRRCPAKGHPQPTYPTNKPVLSDGTKRKCKKENTHRIEDSDKIQHNLLATEILSSNFFFAHFHRSFSEMGAAQNFYSKLPKRLANSLLDFCRQLAASGNEKFDRTCKWSLNIFPCISGYILIILIRALDVRFLFFSVLPVIGNFQA